MQYDLQSCLLHQRRHDTKNKEQSPETEVHCDYLQTKPRTRLYDKVDTRGKIESNASYSNNSYSGEVFIKNGLSLYPDKNILYPNSEFPRQVYQKSMRLIYGFRASYRVHKSWYIIAKYFYERNYSNIRDYRYQKNVYQVGISWQF